MRWILPSLLVLMSISARAQLTLANGIFEAIEVKLPLHFLEYDRTYQIVDSQAAERSQAFSPPKVNLKNLYCPAFFCRVEDAIFKASKVNFKFRLGSVNYVDALEGKGYFEATSNSKATNLQISRTK